MLKSLSLLNFRNFEKIKIDFPEDPKIILFSGANGQGKTNLLEAIYLLSIAKSFRTSCLSDLIQFGETYSFIKGELRSSQINTLEVYLEKSSGKKKALKIDQLDKSPPDFVGNFPVVLFNPQDLNLISLNPSLRRRFLNILNSQIDPAYLRNLIEYKKILKRRNAILNNQNGSSDIDSQLFFWDQSLVKSGAYLLWKRMKTIDYLNSVLFEYYNKIADQNDALSIAYKNSVPLADSLEETEKMLAKELQKKRIIDLQYKTTTIGPHRDDFSFILNKKETPEFCSRGEERSIILALKMAEIKLLKDDKNCAPILLLDDVFSELDDKRKEKLLAIISDYQTIISTAEEGFKKMEIQNYRLINGKIY